MVHLLSNTKYRQIDTSIAGHRFGRLTALYPAMRVGSRKIAWTVLCDCGMFGCVQRNNLISGNTRGLTSCRCAKAPQGPKNLKHGMHKTPTYHAWMAMRNRCNTKSAGNYARYGAAGVSVCERWNDFANFFVDMGEKPAGMSLDRINPYGNYEPTNCRWATPLQQTLNTRKNWDKKKCIPISTMF